MSSITSIVTSTISSSTAGTPSAATGTVTSSPSPSPSQNQQQQQQQGDNPGNFYKNLFYILIGLLAAFGVVSFLSLMRARRRRSAIIREAERLGVLVPGVPGYIPIRERRTMTWARSDGSEAPDWWEVEPGEKEKEGIAQAGQWRTGDAFGTGQDDFQPLAIIPPPEERPQEPIAVSPLPYFPNHLAYRASSLLPPPSRYRLETPETLNDLSGEHLDLVTIIRMPFEDRSDPAELRRVGLRDDDDDPEGVTREWGGIELGIEKVQVEQR